MIQRLTAWLSGTRGVPLTVLIATLIALPALRLGFQADDHVLAVALTRGEPAWSLFRISEALVAEGREVGAVAWWASPHMHGEFLRPLSSLSMALQLWMGAPAWQMLMVNVLVHAACAWFGAQLYRRLAPSLSSAALAGLMFAVDDAQAHSVGWISGRNTMLALLGSLAALWFHVRAADTGKRRHALASLLAAMFALGAGEAGTWAYAFLFAYAWLLDTRPAALRIAALAPQLIVGAAWAAIYVRGGYGFHHTSWYLEPAAPWHVLVEGIANVPLYLTSLLGPSVIAFSVVAPLWQARLLLLPVAACLLWMLWPALWSSRSSRFFGLVTALGTLPAFLTVPQDRVLIGASFGAFGWIASALHSREGAQSLRQRCTRRVLLACHVWIAAAMFVPMLAAQTRFEVASQAITALAKPDRVVVLINTPVELLANYTVAEIARAGVPSPPPRAVHQLYTGGSELSVERTDARTLEVTAARGWGYLPVERIFCAADELPQAGEQRRVHGMSIRVLESTPEGAPSRVRFTFDQTLESDTLQWLAWTEAGKPTPFQPPAVGEHLRIAAMSLLKALP
ncbi:MAG: hypothetical protein RL385_861 [Pseudomonadota bacterium]|jgi:hypothetical protein